MVWFVVLISLLLQYFVNLRSKSLSSGVLNSYVSFIFRFFPKLMASTPWVSVIILSAPLVLLGSLLMLWCHHVVYSWVYFLFSVLVYWLFTNMKRSSSADELGGAWIESELQSHFAPMFWYVLSFGFAPFFIYIVFRELNRLQATEGSALTGGEKIKTVFCWLNWIPVKLLGLTFALVGHFQLVIKLWREHLLMHSLNHSENLVVLSSAALKGGVGNHDGLDVIESQSYKDLCNHSTVVWLLVVLFATLVTWMA
jgi:AmpE protein